MAYLMFVWYWYVKMSSNVFSKCSAFEEASPKPGTIIMFVAFSSKNATSLGVV